MQNDKIEIFNTKNVDNLNTSDFATKNLSRILPSHSSKYVWCITEHVLKPHDGRISRSRVCPILSIPL